jgi:lipid II isoglutaminyl synthase (glutamine-hydrolysing)
MIVSLCIYPTVWLAKLLFYLSKSIKGGSGTSLPGLFIEKYIPWVLGYFDDKFDEIILITGTNGKTTTRALLAHIYEDNGVNIVTNRGGANIFRGIASSLVLDPQWRDTSRSRTLILEVEEATLPKLTKYIKPDKLVITNIFRDQLDAYGEIDSTLQFFKDAIAQSSHGKNLEIIINGDDHKLLTVVPKDTSVVLFGLSDAHKPKYEKTDILHTVLTKSTVKAINIQSYQGNQSAFDLDIDSVSFSTSTQLPGTYNIYNILAAAAVAYPVFGDKISQSITTFKPVFGRGEQINIGDSLLHLFLVKNPAGFDEVLNFISKTNPDNAVNMSFLINDNIADGKDVSWLWDIDIETFVEKQPIGKIMTSGTRGLDMLLRLEYAGCDVKIDDNYDNIGEMIEVMSRQKKEYYVLCTYTALTATRSILEIYTRLSKITDAGN